MEASRGLLELGTPGSSAFRLVNPVPRRTSLSVAKDPVIAPPAAVVPVRPATPSPEPASSSYQPIPAIVLGNAEERSRARNLFLEPLAASVREVGPRIATVFAAVNVNSQISPKRDDTENKGKKRRTINSVTPKSPSLAPIEEEAAMPDIPAVSTVGRPPSRRSSKKASVLYRSLHA